MDEVERQARALKKSQDRIHCAKCLLAAENVPGGYAEVLAGVWGLSVYRVQAMARKGHRQMMIEEANNVPL